MPDFINLTCPSCGGKLQITNDVERFSCGYCGNESVVRRAGGIVTITPLVEGLNRINSGVDKTASELAIARLTQEIRYLDSEIENQQPNFLMALLLFLVSFFPILGIIQIILGGLSEHILTFVGQIVGIGALLLIVYLIFKKIIFYLANPGDILYKQKASKLQELQKHRSIVANR